MGILRTDKISGLENPTAVTGSVEFDGSGDYLQTPDSEIFSMGTNDYTIEGWFYFTTLSSTQRLFGQRASDASELQMLLETNSSGELTYYFSISSSKNVGGVVATKVNTWHHIAVVRKDLVHTLYVDGVSVATNSTDTGSLDNRAQPFSIGRQGNYTSDAFNGHISNFRICKGTAVYTSDFTVPTHALEVTQDTVLLCCNNSDSVTASDHGTVGAAPPTLTANGDPAVSSINPGLTRDFTYGTEFKGVTTFDTQGYFVPPSGTTEQRYSKGVGNGRALFTGGYDSPATINTIDYITVSTTGNAKDFGDLVSIRLQPGSLSSSTRGLIGGGRNPGVTSDIDFVTIASTGNGFDFGDLTAGRRAMAALSNSSRGIWAGGDSPSRREIIDFVTISTTSNAVDFGDLSEATNTFEGCSSSTRGLLMGGENATSPGGTNDISFFTIASLGNAQDFGNLTEGRRGTGSCSSSTRGLCGGGFDSPSLKDTIDFVTIASTGNATDFGNLTVARWLTTSTSNSIRGVWGGGYNPSPAAEQDVIDYVTIATLGNAQDFGNLQTSRRSLSSCSDSHGGLS